MWDSLRPLPFDLPPKQQRHLIPNGAPGTEATIAKMRELVTLAKRDGRIRALSIQIINDCPGKDFRCYAQKLHDWITENIKYLHDPPGVETLVAPWLMLQHKGGDCDDHVMLFASLCEAAGLPARFVCIKADPNSPGEYSHVFSQVFVNGTWVTSDTTMPQHPFGWDPGPSYPRKMWPSSHDKAEFPEEIGMLGRLNRFSRIGATAEETRVAESTIAKFLSGEYARELGQARRDIGDKQADLQAMLSAVNNAPANAQGQLFDMWNRAQAQMKKEQASLQNAINKYNALANDIQTYTGGAIKAPQLGIVWTPLAIAGVALSAALAFSWAMSAWRGDAATNQGYLQQLSSALRAGGTAVEQTGKSAFNFGLLALVAAGGYVLYQALKKRGTV